MSNLIFKLNNPLIISSSTGVTTRANEDLFVSKEFDGLQDNLINIAIGQAVETGSSVTFNSVTADVTGDITAFASDIRLKTNIEPIENALDKVCKLHGFTYNFNEIGQSLGFDGDTVHAGVSAQDVQEVLPEVVRSAPASNEYITVQYEKLVPLLIEAIKDLNAKVDYLEQKLLDK